MSTIGMSGFIFLIFLTLKLTYVIDWSWFWVSAPLWIPYSICVFLFVIHIIARNWK